MPLKKRILYDATSYHRKDSFEESSIESCLQDQNMSSIIGRSIDGCYTVLCYEIII